MFPEGHDYDFGAVDRGPAVQHAFRIVNQSDVPIELTHLRVSCGCATTRPTKKILQPDEDGQLEVTLDTRRFSGQKTTSLYLTTELAGATEEFKFSVKAIIVDIE